MTKKTIRPHERVVTSGHRAGQVAQFWSAVKVEIREHGHGIKVWTSAPETAPQHGIRLTHVRELCYFAEVL
ncbi:MAG: hypothetical protein KC492_22180 [Myxococcales bacterium]|nr:hypothetical protein [Myxococcales bacterium]